MNPRKIIQEIEGETGIYYVGAKDKEDNVMPDSETTERVTNEQIREEMMEHIEYLKMIDLCNKAGMHGKEEDQVRKESKERLQELYDMLLEVEE